MRLPTSNIPPVMRKYGLLALGCTGLGVLLFVFIYYSENGSLASARLLWKKYLMFIALTNAIGFSIFRSIDCSTISLIGRIIFSSALWAAYWRIFCWWLFLSI